MSKKVNINKKHIKVTLCVVAVLSLVALGVFGTLKYQEFIDNVKSDGVTEFVLGSCDEYTNKEKTELWLECEPVR